MSFKDQLAADLTAVFYNTDGPAESVTYTKDGYWPKTIKAIVTYGEGDEYRGVNSYDVNATMTCMVSDVSSSVTNKDTVQIGTETWGVIGGNKINDGLEWKIELNKDT